MHDLHDLELVLRSTTPIIVIESLEEQRILQLFARIGLRIGGLPVFQWTATEGLRRLEAEFNAQGFTVEPTEVLKHIKALPRPGYFVLLDFHPYIDDPLHVRLIKEIAQGYEEVPRTLVFLSYSMEVPPEVRHLTARFDLKLPDLATIKSMIMEEARAWQQRNGHRRFSADREAVTQLANNLVGTTASDARRLIRQAIEDDGAITHSDLPQVMRAKHQLLDQGGVISFELDTARFTDVAGLDNLKRWLEARRAPFLAEASSLDRPKGVLLVGVQGGGKSLAAKAVAGSFGVPLLRLDFGALYNKYIGETEKNLRLALETAKVMAPCVLWMDEVEKGIGQGQNDDGVSQRVLATLLTWMAENRSRVFIVATANAIERLPPELIRKGRLDEIFFVDLPDYATRKEVLSIHLRRRNLAPSGFNLERLAALTEGFTGAEIEQAVVGARYAAHQSDQRVGNDHLVAEIKRTRPLSVVMAEPIARLRAWAEGRTVAA